MQEPDRFEDGLERNPANFQPLTPLGFLARSAAVYPERLAVVHGSWRCDYRGFYDRSRRLASALSARGIGRGEVVSALLLNTPPMLEAHFGVPMVGAVLNTLNTRLDPGTIAYCLSHAHSRMLIVDSELLPLVRQACDRLEGTPPEIVVWKDPNLADCAPEWDGAGYEDILAEGDPEFDWAWPRDEWDAITLNYTSGTTGRPKGVVYHHRGAYLLSMGNILAGSLPRHPVYLWTLPMFHCNGWCFPWTVALAAGTHVCLRQVRDKPIYRAFAEEGVTHMCGAPIVMSVILDAPAEARREFSQRVSFLTAAAPPPETTLAAMADAGFDVIHLYGLTETYGPATICEPQEEWAVLDSTARSAKVARQGVRYPVLEALDVLEPSTMRPVPRDGRTLGEVMFRGNVVMKGYLGNPDATRESFADGWFHSGDLGVVHPDGYVQLKDRRKDIIISGGENISSIEIEEVLYRHPAVSMVAVTAMPDPKWGETPCAFVELVEGASATEAELLAWCRGKLAGFQRPKRVEFGELPKTSTGKIQKFQLRERARSLAGQ